jgi:hypothetical protein
MNIEYNDLRDALEFLEELLAERGWHKYEPRCGYQKQYLLLESLNKRLNEQFQSQLPTLEEVQEVYRLTKPHEK